MPAFEYTAADLRHDMDSRGLSAEALSKQLPGWSHRTIHGWRTGRPIPEPAVFILQLTFQAYDRETKT